MTFLNPFASKFFGYASDEIIGKNLIGTILPELNVDGISYKEELTDVFCFIKKNHLNALQIYQMINRTRKINHMHINININQYKSKYNSLHVSRLRTIAIEVFKCVHKLNPSLLNELFVVKESERKLRDPCILFVPRFRKIQYGKKRYISNI